MIARIWRGKVPRAKADPYFQLMRDVGAEDYRRCSGNRGVCCLRRDVDDLSEVTLITLWDDIDSIRDFAGDAVETAKYYDFDPDYLIDLPERVEHHTLLFALGSSDEAVAGEA